MTIGLNVKTVVCCFMDFTSVLDVIGVIGKSKIQGSDKE